MYFHYAPEGRTRADSVEALKRLLDEDGYRVFLIVACPRPTDIERLGLPKTDALVWKAPDGYDFSAYGIGLRLVAAHSPGADVFVLNDSVYGPLRPLTPFFENSPWELTGFTAYTDSLPWSRLYPRIRGRFRGYGPGHIQSYAFLLKDVSVQRIRALESVFPARFAFADAAATVACQELWLARVASRSMSVGAFYYGNTDTTGDPSVHLASDLVRAGLPFLKRSVFTKHKWAQDTATALEALRSTGYDRALVEIW